MGSIQALEIYEPERTRICEEIGFYPNGCDYHMIRFDSFDACDPVGIFCFGINPGVIWLGKMCGRHIYSKKIFKFIYNLAVIYKCSKVVSIRDPVGDLFCKRQGFWLNPSTNEWESPVETWANKV